MAIVCLLAWTLLAVWPAPRGRAQSATYQTPIDLGTLGGTESKAFGLNNSGQVVGESTITGSAPKHPFIWRDDNGDGDSDPGEMKDLGTLAGGTGTASSVNSSSYAVGNATNASQTQQAFIWRDDNGNGISDPGELSNLGTDGAVALASDINDTAQVVGTKETDPGSLGSAAFVWNVNSGIQLVAGNGTITPIDGSGINNASNIVGSGTVASGTHGFIRKSGSLLDLGTLGGSISRAQEISEDDYVVGLSEVLSPAGAFHAFIWHDDNANGVSDSGELKDLGTLGGTSSFAYDINSTHHVVGSSNIMSGDSHAFLWHDDNGNGANDSGEMKDLNSLIPPGSGWTLQEARSINDNGQIVGFGINPSGQTRAFLLRPAGFSGNVTVAVSPSSVAEDGATNLVYTFTRTGSTTNPLTVNFSVSGTASFTTDYTQSGAASFNSSAGTVTIGAGNSTATVTVDPAVDSALELGETVILTVTSGTGYNIGSPSAATGTITNDDADVSVAVSPSSVIEDGTPNLVYTFTRTGFTSGALTVNFSVGGTATFNTDYTQSGAASFNSTTGTVTFGAGNSTAAVTVDPAADATVEADETVILTVTSGTGYSVGNPSAATGIIVSDDAPVIFAEEGTNYAAAIDSVTFVRGPFTLLDNFNFSNDHRTRIILFTSNLGLTQPDSAVLTVQASGVPLTVENVGPLTGVIGLNASYIIVRLPDGLPVGDLLLTVTHQGVTSNVTILSIAP